MPFLNEAFALFKIWINSYVSENIEVIEQVGEHSNGDLSARDEFWNGRVGILSLAETNTG